MFFGIGGGGGTAEQRAHPLGCLGGFDVMKCGRTAANMTQAWGYLAGKSSQNSLPLQKLKKNKIKKIREKKKKHGKIVECIDFLIQLSFQSAQACQIPATEKYLDGLAMFKTIISNSV